jgi:hypothetical protein
VGTLYNFDLEENEKLGYVNVVCQLVRIKLK